MANVQDVANFFISWANQNREGGITNEELNALLYYAQGQYLARHDKPLFSDAIEAWGDGDEIWGPSCEDILELKI